jgi:hypothetical protein
MTRPPYIARVTQLTVLPEGEPTYCNAATTVTIDDEVGGEFVVVEQSSENNVGKVLIAPEEWPALRRAINRMIAECKAEAA